MLTLKKIVESISGIVKHRCMMFLSWDPRDMVFEGKGESGTRLGRA